MAAIRERKNANGKSKWHAQVRVLGHEPQTQSFDRKTDAKAWAEDTERLIRSGRFQIVNEAQNRDFSELCKKFKEEHMRRSRTKDYTQILGWWEERIGSLRLISIKAKTIQTYLNELMASPNNQRKKKQLPAIAATLTPVHLIFSELAPRRSRTKPQSEKALKMTSVGTGVRYLGVISRVFNVAVDQLEWLEKSPLRGVIRPEEDVVRIPRTLAPAEEARLLAAAQCSKNRFLHVVIKLALRTGMRYNEIMRLRWHDFDFRTDHALVTIRKPKNKRQRIVPVVADALDAVIALRLPLGDGYSEALLFPREKNNEKPVMLRSAWTTCLKMAGVNRFRFHDMRHSAASRWASHGHSLPEIGEILGHVDPRSTQIYTHFAKDHAVKMAKGTAEASIAAMTDLA